MDHTLPSQSNSLAYSHQPSLAPCSADSSLSRDLPSLSIAAFSHICILPYGLSVSIQRNLSKFSQSATSQCLQSTWWAWSRWSFNDLNRVLVSWFFISHRDWLVRKTAWVVYLPAKYQSVNCATAFELLWYLLYCVSAFWSRCTHLRQECIRWCLSWTFTAYAPCKVKCICCWRGQYEKVTCRSRSSWYIICDVII